MDRISAPEATDRGGGKPIPITQGNRIASKMTLRSDRRTLRGNRSPVTRIRQSEAEEGTPCGNKAILSRRETPNSSKTPLPQQENLDDNELSLACQAALLPGAGKARTALFHLFISPCQTASACGGFSLLYLFPTKTASRQRRVFTSLRFQPNKGRILRYSLSSPELSGFFLFYFNDKTD